MICRYVPNLEAKRKSDPRGFIFCDREMTPEELNALRRLWNEQYEGPPSEPCDIEFEPYDLTD